MQLDNIKIAFTGKSLVCHMNTHFKVFASYNILQYVCDFIHVLIFVIVSKCRKSPKLTNIVFQVKTTMCREDIAQLTRRISTGSLEPVRMVKSRVAHLSARVQKVKDPLFLTLSLSGHSLLLVSMPFILIKMVSFQVYLLPQPFLADS